MNDNDLDTLDPFGSGLTGRQLAELLDWPPTDPDELAALDSWLNECECEAMDNQRTPAAAAPAWQEAHRCQCGGLMWFGSIDIGPCRSLFPEETAPYWWCGEPGKCGRCERDDGSFLGVHPNAAEAEYAAMHAACQE